MITLPVHQLPCQENKSLVVSFAWAIYLQKEELVLPQVFVGNCCRLCQSCVLSSRAAGICQLQV